VVVLPVDVVIVKVTDPDGVEAVTVTVKVIDELVATTFEMLTPVVVVVTEAPERFAPVMVTRVDSPAVSVAPVVTLETTGFVEGGVEDDDLLQEWIANAEAIAMPAIARNFNLLVIDFIVFYLRIHNLLTVKRSPEVSHVID
jgi:hypothetical protein